jgi:hypothetical protein
MKNTLNLLLLAVFCVMVAQCSDERVEPIMLEDDLMTSATLYEDQFFTLAITTIITDPSEPLPEQVTFDLEGTGGKISLNWGDGTIEKLIVGTSMVTLEHHYTRVKNYTIKMSGDIKTITSFRVNYLSTKIHDIHFGGLVNLKEVGMNLLGEVPSVINLSRNRSIENVSLSGLPSLKDVLLPTANNLSYVDITGENLLTTAAVDRIIARVHDAVVNKPRAGRFVLGVGWAEDSEKVGPPSSYSINKLRKLRDVYGWTIYPDIN